MAVAATAAAVAAATARVATSKVVVATRKGLEDSYSEVLGMPRYE